MKAFMALFVPSLLVISLAMFAQEPQGRGNPGAPATPAAGAGGQGAPVPAVPGTPGAAGAGGRGDQGAPAGAAGGRGQRGGRGGAGGNAQRGGGGGGKNIQVLTGADIPNTMQTFVQALGLLEKGTCTYCHAEDRSSDEKRPKVVARRMVTMMRAINGTFPDGQQHVTCYTCHRGNTKPLMEPELVQ